MIRTPDWLPPMVSVNPWKVDTFDKLYLIFNRDFKKTQPVYGGKVVWFFPEVDSGRELIFWHLTHRDDINTGDRLPDMRRSERLPWVRAIIDNADQPEIINWDYREGDGSVHTYLWLKDQDFLKKYKDGRRRLITSYFIDQQHKQKKLERKYLRRMS